MHCIQLKTEGRCWRVEVRPGKGWTNYRAFLASGQPVNKRRRIFHMAHNGERWSRTSDLRALRKQCPELVEQMGRVVAARVQL